MLSALFSASLSEPSNTRSAMELLCNDTPFVSCGKDDIRVVSISGMSIPSSQYAICCNLQIISATTKTSYCALSYVCGDVGEIQEILLNGRPFKVRKILFDLLIELLRREMKEFFWIDAICINQLDLAERNQQMAKMDDIYANARRVIVWLGVGTANVARALDNLDKDPTTTWSPTDDSQLRAGALELCRHSYWTRAWTVQEFILGRRVTIWSGSRTLAPSSLRLFLDSFTLSATLRGNITHGVHNKIRDSMAARLMEKREEWHNRRPRRYLSLWDGDMDVMGCSDVRDRVYSMLSLMNPATPVKPDYNKATIDLFLDIVKLAENSEDPFMALWKAKTMLDIDDNDPRLSGAHALLSRDWSVDNTIGRVAWSERQRRKRIRAESTIQSSYTFEDGNVIEQQR